MTPRRGFSTSAGLAAALVAIGLFGTAGTPEPDAALAPGATLEKVTRAEEPAPFLYVRLPGRGRVLASCHGWSPMQCRFTDPQGESVEGSISQPGPGSRILHLTGRGEAEGDGRILPGKTVEIKVVLTKDDDKPGGVGLRYVIDPE